MLAVFLSGFLVTNTISAMMAQQTRQIGIMKSIGARTSDVMRMYFALVLAFGVIGMIIAVPLAYLAATAFTDFFAVLFNFNQRTYGILPGVAGIILFVGLVVPVLAAIFPVLRGTSITIREAISSDGGPSTYGTGLLDRLLERLRGLPRPLLLSLRNTFRRKGRLILTLTTLTLGGAIFISVFTVQASIVQTLDELFASLIRYDVQITFDGDYRVDRLVEEALKVPDVVEAEAWGGILARRLRPDDTDSDTIFFEAPPPGSDMLAPVIIEGRWLLPNDENAVVLSSAWRKDEPDVAIGDTITLKFKGRETDWVVVGFFRGIGSELIAYANYDYFAREVREPGVSDTLNVTIARTTLDYQAQVAQALEEHFRSVGLAVGESSTAVDEKQQSLNQFGIITSLLMIMAGLIAVVGGLGLMGTMSMNVLERTREIGVMRAIGASNLSILNIVISEGVLIGLISWAIGAALAFPISRVLSDQVGILFLGAPFSYVFSIDGALLWLGIAVILAAFASFIPAWNASRLTVRDVIAYDG
ncbi:MAG: FtsX-like permease family protein [Chloroflexaceae bacterium]|nr:FtsX-like permease family protein [Chloroflexaceae bacterium]